jgi:hypothetical protein
MFDDLEGVVPRPGDHVTLAKEIDTIFSSEEYRDALVPPGPYIRENNWDVTADRYLALYEKVS